jgi:murein DD-endopeptidase MepM/ murein hydrolase activator NlpD
MTRSQTVRWLSVAVGVAALAGAYSGWLVMPWAPAFLFPALALVGALVVTRAFVNALVRAVRCYRERGRVCVVAPVVVTAAVVVLVLLPFSRLVGVLAARNGGAPRVLSGFGDWLGAEGYPRANGRHGGVDVAGSIGAAVLAPADGGVIVARDHGGSCGLMVVIEHEPGGYRTIYCHLSAIGVTRGQPVKRGDPIGAIGTSGMRAWPGYEHVHWELQRGRGGPYEDPLPRTIGCFDPARRYPSERLVLTFPVKC